MNKTFVEREFYSDPPSLSKDATESEISSAWSDWIKKEAKARANHKRAWTKSQKPGELPDFDNNGLMVKQGGVWKQRPGMTAYVGSAELGTLETVLFESSKQDRHFQARGKRAGRRKKRNNQNKKEAKRQFILNSMKKIKIRQS